MFVIAAVIGYATVAYLQPFRQGTSAHDSTRSTPPTTVQIPWTSGDGSFTAVFPNTPTVTPAAVTDLTIRKIEMTEAHVGTLFCVVGQTTLDVGRTFDNPHTRLAAAAEGAARGSGGNLVTTTETTYAGYPALRFVIDEPKVDSHAEGLIFITPTDLYLILVQDDSGNTIDLQSFVDSFHLLKDPGGTSLPVKPVKPVATGR